MLNKKLVFLVPILVVVLVVTGNATVFQQISYQGILIESDTIRVNGPTALTFKLYYSASGGTACWDMDTTIDIQDGIVNVILGPISGCDATQQWWLEITVSGDTPMDRIQLTAVPYSMNADHLDGKEASEFYLKTQADDHTQNNIDASELGGYQPGNSSGNIPISNGTVNSNLNADMLDGQHAAAFLSTSNDYGRSGVAPNLYEGSTTLTNLYVNEGQTNSVTSSMITNGTIVNDDISNSANILPSKISGTAWTSTNDGSGTGLDADLLDGQQASVFLSTANDYGRSGVAANLYEGTSTLASKYGDHGALTGLGDDDHPQYLLVSRSSYISEFTGRLNIRQFTTDYLMDFKNTGGARLGFIHNRDGNLQLFADDAHLFISSDLDIECTNVGGTALIPIYASAFYTSSARAIKTDIRHLTERDCQQALADISSMRPAIYQLKEATSGKTQLGLIAEEVPSELVAPRGDAVDLYALTTSLVAAVKALHAEVELQSKTIKELQAEVELQSKTIRDLRGQ